MNPYSQNSFLEFFYTFFIRLVQGFPGELYGDEMQLLVLVCIGISSAIVGTFLVWRKMAMLANALSHTILTGIVLAFLITGQEHHIASDWTLLVAAVLTALVTTFLTQAGVFLFGIAEDASTGIVFTLLFAIGIILVTLYTRNAHIGVELLMGNVDLVQMRDIILSAIIMLINIGLVLLFWRPLFVTSFDPIFAHVLGLSIPLFGYILMTQVAVTAVGAFRAVGVILFLAFLVSPPLTARLWTNQYKKVLAIACGVATMAACMAVALSRHLLSYNNLPCSTGALAVTILFIITVSSLFLRRKHFPVARRSSSVAQ